MRDRNVVVRSVHPFPFETDLIVASCATGDATLTLGSNCVTKYTKVDASRGR